MSAPFPLQIRPLAASHELPEIAIGAWWITGSSVDGWVNEIAAWPVRIDRLEFLVLPEARDSLAPGGVLVLPGNAGMEAFRRIAPGPTVIACRRAGLQLYIPVRCDFTPPVADAELSMWPQGDCAFLHPSIGLVGFERENVLSIENLLERPPMHTTEWVWAHPGAPSPPPLISVNIDEPPTVEDIVEQGRDDIGRQAADIRKLPRVPPARSGQLGDRVHGVGSGLAMLGSAPGVLLAGLYRGLLRITNASPTTSTSPTWINRLEDWLGEKLDKLGTRQAKEIDRLLGLLMTNPDEGLKFALPLNGDSGRGLDGSSDQLKRRNIDFSLSSLGGGGAISPWMIGWEQHQRLIDAYRQAANRELNLGRFRRAAYIFAELLEDYLSAADALENGRYFREAAVLHREKLKNPMRAADCLRMGGFIDEAIAIYEEHEEFETLGLLYAQLGREDDRRTAYLSAVGKMFAAHDWIGASKLLENELDAPDEAIELLRGAWEGVDGTSACLEEEFAILSRLSRGRQAENRVREVIDALPFRENDVPVVLGGVARQFPDKEVQLLAADSTRISVAPLLKKSSRPGSQGSPPMHPQSAAGRSAARPRCAALRGDALQAALVHATARSEHARSRTESHGDDRMAGSHHSASQ